MSSDSGEGQNRLTRLLWARWFDQVADYFADSANKWDAMALSLEPAKRDVLRKILAASFAEPYDEVAVEALKGQYADFVADQGIYGANALHDAWASVLCRQISALLQTNPD